MKELTLEKMHFVGLELMDDLHAFCTENNIKYSLAGGSLIGAIRHKGFIPWDDDIDVMMPRPDYDRFCKMYQSSSKFLLIRPEDSYLPFARLCECEETYVEPAGPWHRIRRNTGIWIDIFPLDGAIENDEEMEETIKVTKTIDSYVWGNRCFLNALNHPLKFNMGFLSFCTLLVKFIVGKRKTIREKMKEFDELVRRIPFGSVPRFAGYTSLVYGKKDRHRNECFSHTIEVDFEERKYCALNGYDEYLKNLFGDYMQLPPEKDRVCKHSQHTYFEI